MIFQLFFFFLGGGGGSLGGGGVNGRRWVQAYVSRKNSVPLPQMYSCWWVFEDIDMYQK